MKIHALTALLFLALCSCNADTDAVKTSEVDVSGVALFDGETLEGWKSVSPKNMRFWSVNDGVIEASNGDKKMPTNTYLATTSEYENFDFTCEFKLTGDHATGLINSGIQYRSLLKQKKGRPVIIGYQADIGKDWWGGIYDEHRRKKLVKGDSSELLKDFDDQGWHTYRILCKGNKHELYIDGHLTASYDELDEKIPAKGVIALQLHKGGIAKIQYKNIFIKEL